MVKQLFLLFLSVYLATSFKTHVLTPVGALQPLKQHMKLSSVQGASAIFPSELKSPSGIYSGYVYSGAAKTEMSSTRTLLSAFLAGCQISIGVFLSYSLGQSFTNGGLQKLIMGLFGLPLGFLMIAISGGDLFATDSAMLASASVEKKIQLQSVFNKIGLAFLGNFIGCIVMAYLVHGANTLGKETLIVTSALLKSTLTFKTAFVRGVLGNWLACMAMYMASGATSLVGKLAGLLLPVAAISVLHLEFSVSNMFLLPLSMLRGSGISVAELFMNCIIPVTLGNIVGGLLFMTIGYGSLNGSILPRLTGKK